MRVEFGIGIDGRGEARRAKEKTLTSYLQDSSTNFLNEYKKKVLSPVLHLKK